MHETLEVELLPSSRGGKVQKFIIWVKETGAKLMGGELIAESFPDVGDMLAVRAWHPDDTVGERTAYLPADGEWVEPHHDDAAKRRAILQIIGASAAFLAGAATAAAIHHHMKKDQ